MKKLFDVPDGTEFQSMLADAMFTDTGQADLKALFDSLDKDGDGNVNSKKWGESVFENKDVMAKYFGGTTMAEIGGAFAGIGANKDGHLTWEEFVAASKHGGKGYTFEDLHERHIKRILEYCSLTKRKLLGVQYYQVR